MWYKIGYNSLNGMVTGISVDTGKCIDYRIRMKNCKICQSWEEREDSGEYEEFISAHELNFDTNHHRSAGSVEDDELIKCLKVTEKNRKLRYINYLGDGDSKSFLEISKLDIYPQKQVRKLECVDHIQKWLGSRMRKLKSTKKGPLSDRKTLGGKGSLTNKMINKLQNYFGIAIRQCAGKTVFEIKRATRTVLFHCSETSNLDTKYQMCPWELDSWCKYQADKQNNTATYKDKLGLPAAVRELIKPIFTDLSNDELLKKCFRGKTQNNKESIKNLIWKRCPKDVYVGRTVLEIGNASAVINFNEAFQIPRKFLKNLV